jgi:LysM repeat protein
VPKRPTDKDNAKKSQAPAEEPWNNQFEDDLDDNGSFSRVKKRKQTRGNKILTTSLIVLLVLVLMVPIVWQAVNQKMKNSATTATRISVTSKSSSVKDISSSSEKSSSSSKKESSSSSSSSTNDDTSSVSSSSKAESKSSSSASSSASSSSSSSTTATGSYTVKAGDNLYRIAVNHGMTLSQIQALNGMGSSVTVTPGQVLKVK